MSDWVYPVPDKYGLYVTEPFGTRRGNGIHEGTDYRTYIGTELYAVADGVVESVVRMDPRGGNYVRIRLDSGLVRDARYSHLSRIDVPLGKRVRKGEIIGLSGDTGNVTGPHLHFGIKNNAGRYIDPHAFLRSQKATVLNYAPSTPITKPVPIPEEDMPLNADDKAWIQTAIRNEVHTYFKGVAQRDTAWDRAVGNTFDIAMQRSLADITRVLADMNKPVALTGLSQDIIELATGERRTDDVVVRDAVSYDQAVAFGMKELLRRSTAGGVDPEVLREVFREALDEVVSELSFTTTPNPKEDS